MRSRTRTAATFIAGLATGAGVALMLASGRATTSEPTVHVTQHGDYVALWSVWGSDLLLVDALDADRELAEHLDAKFQRATNEYGPDDVRTQRARQDMDRYTNKR